MAAPRKQSLTDSRNAVKALRPLPKNYGMRVADMFPHIDLQLLYRMVAGRVEYPAGLKALEVICAVHEAKKSQQLSHASQLQAA